MLHLMYNKKYIMLFKTSFKDQVFKILDTQLIPIHRYCISYMCNFGLFAFYISG